MSRSGYVDDCEIVFEKRKPDIEKLLNLGKALSRYQMPEMTTVWGNVILDCVEQELVTIQDLILEAIERMDA